MENKLYTEEQIRKTWNAAYIDALGIDEEDYKPKFFEDFIESLTPIELPSDDEIEEALFHQSNEYAIGFHDAFNFLKNKLSQNKQQ